MDVPESLREKIRNTLKRLDDESKRQEKARQASARKEAEIDALRESRRDELLAKREEIIKWLDDFFFSTLEARQMLALQNRIVIFRAHFWRGEPAPAGDIATHAVIELECDGDLNYAERCKSGPPHRTVLGNLQNPGMIDLYGKLHPEFIDQWLSAIQTGKVWEYIEQSLR